MYRLATIHLAGGQTIDDHTAYCSITG